MLTNFIGESFWFLVLAGWILLLIIGLEADKPLSGGIPGHRQEEGHHSGQSTQIGDWLGEQANWVLFVGIGLLLPVLLTWIFVIHP